MRKSLFFCMLVLSAAVIALSGCKSENGSKEVSKVVLWHGWGGTEAEVLDSIITSYEANNPGIDIQTLVVSFDDLRSKYETASASGEGPDFVIGPNDWVGGLATAGLIKSLEEFDPEVKNYLEPSVEALRYENELYGLPISLKVLAMYYNKSMVSEPAKTIDELLQHSQEGKVVALNAGFYHAFWGLQVFGGKLFDHEARCVVDEGGFSDWLDWLHEAKKNYPSMEIADDYGKMNAMFKEKKAAYYPDGPWALGDLKKVLGDDLGIAVLPSGPAGKSGPFLGVESFMFNSASEFASTGAALDFIKHFNSVKNQTMLMEKAGIISANTKVDIKSNEHIAIFLKQADSGVPFPNFPEMAAVWTTGTDAYTKVLEGIVEGDEAAKEAALLINQANNK